MLPLFLALLALAPMDPPTGPSPGDPPSNLLILIADDMGVEELTAYAEGSDYALTPTLDGMAAQGLLFRNAWATPTCSPARAAIQTGRRSYQTGVGNVINPGTYALQLDEFTLPEMIDAGTNGAYQHATFGKWHLGNDTVGGILHPNLSGWGHFAGTLDSFTGGQTYESWIQIVDGVENHVTTYATTEEVDRTLEWVDASAEPWCVLLGFNAPHKPFHEPPSELHSVDFSGLSGAALSRARYRAAVEALDTELGRLFAGLGERMDRTHVIFVADNGTPADVASLPVLPDHAKNTVFEGGVNVPLLIQGPGVAVPGAESDALVVVSDIFATVAELAGVDLEATLPVGVEMDSVSLVPYMDDPQSASQRSTVFTQSFFPGGLGTPNFFDRAMRNERFKLISTEEDLSSFYDLWSDPYETNDLLREDLSSEAQVAYEALFAEMYAQLGLQTASTEPYGCGINPVGSLKLLAGDPTPGDLLILGVDNPFGTQGIGAMPLILLAIAADPGFPCGTQLPGLGMSAPGATAELLVALNGILSVPTGAPWGGPGVPAPVAVPVPNFPVLLGRDFFVQGVLWDPLSTHGIEYALSDALVLHLGPAL